MKLNDPTLADQIHVTREVNTSHTKELLQTILIIWTNFWWGRWHQECA